MLTFLFSSVFISCKNFQQIEPVYGIPNVDDDDQNGTLDWDDELPEGEDDLSELVIPKKMFSGLRRGVELRLRQETDNFRIYLDDELRMNSADDYMQLENEDDQDLVLFVEMKNYNSTGELILERFNDSGVLDSMDIEMFSAPLLLNHHLQPMRKVYAMSGTSFVNNQDFIDGLENALGDDFTSYPVRDYEWDVWLQDEVEFGTLSSPFNSVDVVVDSIRDRGLDPLPEDHWESPNFPIKTWGSGTATSQDSFGNLEVSPPVTVDGVEYPHGRIYYGYWRSELLSQSLQDFLINQEVQEPFQIDITWLCVGHVDEFLTFVPDASSEKGFKMLITDTVAGYEFLESLDRSMSIPKYGADHHYDTIGDILDDTALRALNEDIQLDYLNPALEVLQTELGVTEDDIIRVPMLFEEAYQCGGYTATLLPGTVNMIVATNEDGTGAKLIMPDPYLRSDISDQSSDPFIAHINSLLPAGNEPYWIDDWSEYHMMLGEVHCGSNTLRTPSTTYWNQQ
jgi:hypothetical protein